MHRIGKDRAERLEIVPVQLRVIVTVSPKYSFCQCAEGETRASASATASMQFCRTVCCAGCVNRTSASQRRQAPVQPFLAGIDPVLGSIETLKKLSHPTGHPHTRYVVSPSNTVRVKKGNWPKTSALRMFYPMRLHARMPATFAMQSARRRNWPLRCVIGVVPEARAASEFSPSPAVQATRSTSAMLSGVARASGSVRKIWPSGMPSKAFFIAFSRPMPDRCAPFRHYSTQQPFRDAPMAREATPAKPQLLDGCASAFATGGADLEQVESRQMSGADE